MQQTLINLKKIADVIAVLMLSALFLTFCLQIYARYWLNEPLSWSTELCATLWLWLIFFASAFCLSNKDHVRFDVLYNSAPRSLRRVFFLLSSVAVIIAFVVSYEPTWSYIDFYKIKKSGTLKLKLNYVFSIYGVFLSVMIIRFAWGVVHCVTSQNWGQAEEELTGQ